MLRSWRLAVVLPSVDWPSFQRRLAELGVGQDLADEGLEVEGRAKEGVGMVGANIFNAILASTSAEDDLSPASQA